MIPGGGALRGAFPFCRTLPLYAAQNPAPAENFSRKKPRFFRRSCVQLQGETTFSQSFTGVDIREHTMRNVITRSPLVSTLVFPLLLSAILAMVPQTAFGTTFPDESADGDDDYGVNLALGGAPPAVTRISADTVDTAFDPSGGAFGLGTLLLEQDTPIEIDYDNGLTEVFEDGSIQIWTDLFDDTSSGDLASGYFKGGEFAIFDDDDNILLSGNVDWFLMGEVFDDMGFMGGTGHFVVTGGELMDNFGTLADVFDVTFRLDPMDIDDFNTAFTGESDLTIIPVVPEPSTIFLMIGSASGLAVIAGIMRRKTRPVNR